MKQLFIAKKVNIFDVRVTMQKKKLKQKYKFVSRHSKLVMFYSNIQKMKSSNEAVTKWQCFTELICVTLFV